MTTRWVLQTQLAQQCQKAESFNCDRKLRSGVAGRSASPAPPLPREISETAVYSRKSPNICYIRKHLQTLKKPLFYWGFNSAPGMNRTCDLRFRKPLLYPLSYGSGDGAKCGAKFATISHVIYLEVSGTVIFGYGHSSKASAKHRHRTKDAGRRRGSPERWRLPAGHS